MTGAGKIGFANVPSGATILIGLTGAVLRNPAVRRRVEKDRADCKPNRAIDGALKLHIDRPISDLCGRSSEVYGQFVAANTDRHVDRQIPAGRDLLSS